MHIVRFTVDLTRIKELRLRPAVQPDADSAEGEFRAPGEKRPPVQPSPSRSAAFLGGPR